MIRHVGLLTDEQPQETPAAFVCPHCGKEYKTEAALKAHCTKEHAEEFDTSEK
jgi:predicted RNA-binding Zn-ribbon protein involved in translation (DUF1610 family)